MIAYIDRGNDIAIYLEGLEIEEVSTRTLEGIIIKLHRPKQQGRIFLAINGEMCRKINGCCIAVLNPEYDYDNNVGEFKVFFDNDSYDRIRGGKTGTRYDSFGSKVTIIDANALSDFDLRIVRRLKHYVEARDKLPESLA